MASKRILKREVNNVLGDLITKVYAWETANPASGRKESEAIIDDAIATFDTLIGRINEDKIENPSKHFKGIHTELSEKATDLAKKIKTL